MAKKKKKNNGMKGRVRVVLAAVAAVVLLAGLLHLCYRAKRNPREFISKSFNKILKICKLRKE